MKSRERETGRVRPEERITGRQKRREIRSNKGESKN